MSALARDLKAAIRAITVDVCADHGPPTGDTERRFNDLSDALDRGDIDEARRAFEAMSDAQHEAALTLAEAATAFFGGDFTAYPEGGR